jgi:predicted DNA-binding protein
MEFHLTAETEARLNELAQRTHRGTDELLAEAVEHLVTYNEWTALTPSRDHRERSCGTKAAIEPLTPPHETD